MGESIIYDYTVKLFIKGNFLNIPADNRNIFPGKFIYLFP